MAAGASGSKATVSPKGAQSGNNGSQRAAELGPPRILVDPDSLVVVDPQGSLKKGKSIIHRRGGGGGSLTDPRKTSTPPRNRSPLRGYSDKEKEDVGMQLVSKLLGSDRDEIVDLRTQRGVGADAIDSMKRFYELKVIAGPEPDQVTLTNSEVRRAMSTDKFFLIVISGVEGVDARPKLRVFVDPLNQLQQTHNGSITLSGVRRVESLVYEYGHAGDSSASHAELEGQEEQQVTAAP